MIPFYKISQKLIAISLIVIVGIHSLNSLIYTHSHKLDDGTVITHAHPFSKSSDTDPYKSHEHSSEELTFLANLIYFIPSLILTMVSISLIAGQNFYTRVRNIICKLSFHSPPLRAPPCLF